MCNISDISEGHRCLQAQGLKMYKETTGLVPRLLKLAKQFNCFYLEGRYINIFILFISKYFFKKRLVVHVFM